MIRKQLRSSRGNLNCKRASGSDLFFIIFVLLGFSIISLIGFKVMSAMNDQFQLEDSITSRGKSASSDLTSVYTSTIDNMFLFATIVLAIISIILASLVYFHPLFMVLYIIVYIPMLIFAGIASNIFQEMAANAGLASEAAQMTFMSGVMNYLPLIMGVVGMVLMVIMFKIKGNAE